MCAMTEVPFAVGELNLTVGGMNITIDKGGGLDRILTRGSDAAMIWLCL
jgi:hypothetical protein